MKTKLDNYNSAMRDLLRKFAPLQFRCTWLRGSCNLRSFGHGSTYRLRNKAVSLSYKYYWGGDGDSNCTVIKLRSKRRLEIKLRKCGKWKIIWIRNMRSVQIFPLVLDLMREYITKLETRLSLHDAALGEHGKLVEAVVKEAEKYRE